MTQHPSVRSRIRSVVVVLALVATAAGCGKAPAGTPAPSGTPTATSGPPAATLTPLPNVTPTPAPTRLPNPVAGAWVAAGSTVRDYLGARLLALPDGGAVLIGRPLDEDGVALQGVLAAELWNKTTGWQAGASTEVRWTADASGRSPGDARDPVLVDRINGAPGVTFAVVVLLDGRVLVAGGDDDNGHSITNVSIYDPGSDAWSAAAPMGEARSHASAAVLPDGRVLVVGGFAWEPFDDTASAQGVQPASARARLEPPERDGVLLLDVAPYPLGPALATAEVFDPASGTWSPAGPMRYARTGPAIATLSDGRILVVGASDETTRIDARAFTTAEVWDGETGTFKSAGTLPAFDRERLARRGVDLPAEPPEHYGPIGTLVALSDGGAVFIAQSADWKHSGQVVWSARLSPDLATWHRIGEPFGAHEIHDDGGWGTQVTGVCRAGAVVVGLADGSVLVGGGSPGTQVSVPAPVSVLRYDPASESWSSGPDLPEPRYGSLGVRLYDRTVLLVAGGDRQDGSGGEDTARWPTWRLVPGEWYGGEQP